MVYVLIHFSGMYVFDENLKFVKKYEVNFDKEDIKKIKEGKASEKELEILNKIREEFSDVKILGSNRDLGFPTENDPEKINKALAYVTSELKKEDLERIQKYMVEITIEEISESVSRDHILIHAVNALDDLNKIINLMIERFREWYGLYAPEVSMAIENHEKFISKVLEKDREELMRELGIDMTMGGEFSEKDLKVMKDYAERISSMYKLRKKIVEYIEELMSEIAPNVKEVAGAIIGARLISLAGGIKELALLPASTIQVLGAEKALFRHLRSGTPPPKHGILFNHPLIQKLPKKLRGRMARTLASKISIAAKVDAFSPGRFIGDKLRKEVEKRFEQLKNEIKS